MRNNPQPQEVYKHFKGNLYQIRCLARHSETREILVIYQAMYGDFEIYARPLSMFMEEVDRNKYPDAVQKYRFELQKGRDINDGNDTRNINDGSDTSDVVDAGQPQADDTEEFHIDPLLLQFLDADSYERKLDILDKLHNRIDDKMINTMAVAIDLEVKDGDLEDRYMELRNCLLTFKRYECNRLR